MPLALPTKNRVEPARTSNEATSRSTLLPSGRGKEDTSALPARKSRSQDGWSTRNVIRSEATCSDEASTRSIRASCDGAGFAEGWAMTQTATAVQTASLPGDIPLESRTIETDLPTMCDDLSRSSL